MKADEVIADFLRQALPGLKTQAQYDAVAGAFEAARLIVNAVIEADPTKEKASREALEVALDAVRKTTELSAKLEDEPEATSSKYANAFRAAPAQFTEREEVVAMLAELAELKTRDEVLAWYAQQRDRRERIVSKSLRDELYDAVRAKLR